MKLSPTSWILRRKMKRITGKEVKKVKKQKNK